MATNGPKTIKDLDIRELQMYLNYKPEEYKGKDRSLAAYLTKENADTLAKMLEYVKETVKEENKRLKIYKSLDKYLKSYAKIDREKEKILKNEIDLLDKSTKEMKKQVTTQDLLNDLRREGNYLLKDTIKNNAEIFRIAHDMQLESNVTWKNYRKLYSEAYEATRKANKEVEQSIHNVKDLVETQNRLLGTGWRNIDTQTLTNVSSAVMMLQKTLGKLDTSLVNALQQSYRVLGDQTNTFILNLGNRLNEFSNTFGVTVDMLSVAVTDMIESNNFIHRSNLTALTAANESLIKASTLVGATGLMSTSFITKLAEVAQFGTMEEMASIYQGGALLQGFDTQRFQQQMIESDYEGATEQLLRSIYGTLNNIDDHYLRAEYMQQIGSAFGLSRDELKVIATSGVNLDEYSKQMQEKLFGVNTSMKDELTDLRVNLVDRVQNAIQNSWASEQLGSALQELGLYGLEGYMVKVLNWLRVIGTQSLAKNVAGVLGKSGGTASILSEGMLGKGQIPVIGDGADSTIKVNTGRSAVLAGVGRVALGAGGLAVGIGANQWGSSMIRDPERNANWGGAINTIGGSIGGAMLGGAVTGGPVGALLGGLAGLGYGIYNTSQANKERESALQELEDQERAARRANAASTFVDYGDPVVNAINAQTQALVKIISGNHEENKTFILLGETYKKTTTLSEV